LNRARTAQDWATHRRRQATQPTRLTATVATLLRKAAEAGQPVTDDALARTLAISPARVRHHRRVLGA
jgi:hypothetical protein